MENKQLSVHEETRLTSSQVVANVRLIQQVMADVMKKDTHYGIIPGCKQPSLYKAGSEVLLTTFRIAVEPEVTNLSTTDEIRYLVRVVGRHQISGIVVGIGVGEASSSEDKYKWRNAVCDDEFELTPEDRKRIKYGRKQNGFYKAKQVRTNPADLANTILKMAKKRAQVDMTLTATAASDIFTQDIEDLPEDILQEEQAPIQQPKPKEEKAEAPVSTAPINEGMKRVILAKVKQTGKSEDDLCRQFKVETVDALPSGAINDILKWLSE